MSTTRVAIVGVGGLGGALARGLLKQGVAPDRLTLCDAQLDKARALGARVTLDAVEAAGAADVVVICVKPGDVPPLLDVLSPAITPSMTVVSAAAGVTLGVLRQGLGANGHLVRAMPNVNVAVGASVTALVAEPEEAGDGLERAEWLFRHVGTTVRLAQEKLMDASTALGASGPAFVAVMVEALMDGGVLAGLPRALAVQLALEMVEGTARHLREAGMQPGALNDMVMSPAGTTAAGVAVMEQRAVRGALMDAVQQAALRARALGQG